MLPIKCLKSISSRTFACQSKVFVNTQPDSLIADNMAAAFGRRAVGALAGALSQRGACAHHQSPCAASELLSRYSTIWRLDACLSR